MELSTWSKDESVEDLRAKLDVIDDQIAHLLVRRYLASQQIQSLKWQVGGAPPQDTGREASIVARLQHQHPLIPSDVLRDLYDRIFKWMRREA